MSLKKKVFICVVLIIFLIGLSPAALADDDLPDYSGDKNMWVMNQGDMIMDAWIFWPMLLMICLLFGGLGFYVLKQWGREDRSLLEDRPEKTFVIGVFAAAVILRMVLAMVFWGHGTDMSCFSAWALRMVGLGPAEFYAPEYFSDYPPGYMLVLGALGLIVNGLGLAHTQPLFWLIIKLPAIICDVLLAYVLYRYIARRYGPKKGFLFALLLLLNPALWGNSALWGQIDSVLTLLLVMCFIMLDEDKLWQGCLLFTLALLIKPQALMVGPALLWYAVDYFRRHKKAAIRPALTALAVTVPTVVAAALPFSPNQHWSWLFEKYAETMRSYSVSTLNAPNVFGLFNLNFLHSDAVSSLGLTYSHLGWLGIAVSFALTFWVCWKNRGEKGALMLSSAVMIIAAFMLGPNMHERYIFPGIIFLFFAAAQKKNLWYGVIASALSVVQFITIMVVLRVFLLPDNYPLFPLLSLANMVLFIWLMAIALREDKIMDAQERRLIREERRQRRKERLRQRTLGEDKPYKKVKWTRIDIILIALLTLSYGVVGMSRLGEKEFPQTFWKPESRKMQYILDFGYSVEFDMTATLASINDGKYTLSFSDDPQSWDQEEYDVEQEVVFTDFFTWNQVDLSGKTARYVRITPDTLGFRMLEMGFVDVSGNIITPVIYEAPQEEEPLSHAFDEQYLVKKNTEYMSSMYFDEIYHARTAYEQIRGWRIYELTHPPLGKNIMMLGIELFGMTPYGWRFTGALVGALMVPAMYVLGKLLFGKSRYAFITAFLMAVDFMHYAQTRIATIDSYSVLWIILMYIFMWLYLKGNFYDTKLWKTLVPLAFCGIFFGIGAATKWICIYAGGGLAVLFFFTLLRRWQEYRFAKKNLYGDTNITAQMRYEHIVSRFPKNVLITIAWCLLFFIVVPCLIYYASYAPYVGTPNHQDMNQLEIVLNNQQYMWKYHRYDVLELVGDTPHPYESRWYTWPVMVRPIFYFMGENMGEGLTAGISSFGNPAVWWVGLIAVFYAVWAQINRRRKPELYCVNEHPSSDLRTFIWIALAAQFLPWTIVPRSTYIYHYFASVPFIILLIVLMIKDFLEPRPESKARQWTVGIYLVAALVLFGMFYPLLTGIVIPTWYAAALRWLPSWVLYKYWE
ncbi:MAG: glycosyltransferase family 39 protein [Christensenellales bacterium]|jgi:dolichyl-phosphate-mannose-protein mannosyltransferase